MKYNISTYSNELDDFLKNEIKLFYDTIPYAKHLTESNQPINEKYYIRHRIETVKRINLTARTDSLALAKMIDENYDLARKWGKYTIQEMNHDLMFLADLAKHGISKADVTNKMPFKSTITLINYLEKSIHQYGSLPAVFYSLFVEWNSDRYSKKVVEKTKIQFSPQHVKGAEAHVNFDDHHDHYQLILEIAYHLSNGTIDSFFILKDISTLFREYFQELYEETIG